MAEPTQAEMANAYTVLAEALKKQERAQVRLGIVGLLGLGLLGATGYLLFWRKR